MRKGDVEQATIEVAAPPELVYDVVSDVTRIPEWSPECSGARWRGGASEAREGARFEGRNRRGLLRWRTWPRVDAADRPNRFAFTTTFPVIGDQARWTYAIEPGAQPGTSRVTESLEMVGDQPLPLALAVRYGMRVPDRRADLRDNLETSLQRLRVVVEGEAQRL